MNVMLPQLIAAYNYVSAVINEHTKTFGQRCFSHCAQKQWNSLPSDVRHSRSSRAFKTALKTRHYKHYHK